MITKHALVYLHFFLYYFLYILLSGFLHIFPNSKLHTFSSVKGFAGTGPKCRVRGKRLI